MVKLCFYDACSIHFIEKVGMLDQKQFISAVTQIAEEKGIPEDKIVETIEMALSAAYKKDYGQRGQMVRVDFDIKTGNMKFFQLKLVVDESILREEKEEEEGEGEEGAEPKEETVPKEIDEEEERKVKFNDEKHVMIVDAKRDLLKGRAVLVRHTEEIEEAEDKIQVLKDAEREKGKKASDGVEIYDYIELPLKSQDSYGRIAAQTAKQVIMQRIREAERDVVFSEFKSREGEVVSGSVQRMEGGSIFVDIGRATGIMFFNEQIPGERYNIGQRVRAYIIKVERDAKGSLVALSRSHPRMVTKLFEFEVPEIESGTVEIKSISREAGSRSKIAVFSDTEGVDPVGSCVGQKGTRVSTIINELGGEKIDIIEWSEDQTKFIANALAPAKVSSVKLKEETREAKVEVDEDQLSLAIGKRGQNVRLAAKLTGWKIDIIAGGKKVEDEEKEDEKEDKKEKGKKEDKKPAKKKAKKDDKKDTKNKKPLDKLEAGKKTKEVKKTKETKEVKKTKKESKE